MWICFLITTYILGLISELHVDILFVSAPATNLYEALTPRPKTVSGT